MATPSFPSIHCFHPPVDCRITSYFSCLLLPLSYTHNPSSINSPQSFEFGDGIKHVANWRSCIGSRVLHLRLKSLVAPCQASISKITAQELTCQHCSCSTISSNQCPRTSLFHKHPYKSRASRKKRTMNFKVNQMNFALVGFQTGSPGMSRLASFNLLVALNAECDIEELDVKEELIDHEGEKPSSRIYSGIHRNVEVRNMGIISFMNEKGSGNKLRYLEERDEEVLSKQILELSRSNKLTSALELFRSMGIYRLKPNLHSCNSLLSCLLRNSMLDDALEVFEYMKNKRIISGHSYSLVFKAVAKARGSDEAIKMFMDTVRESDHEKDFDVVVYNTIISVCAKANDWFQMERVWSIMKENGHLGTTVTYNILICTFVRCGQYDLSIAAYSEMLQNGINPGADSMHAIIGACSKEGKWGLAMSVFENMLVNELKPNLIAFNALINLLGRCGKVEEAFTVYNQMKLFGHMPDAHTWNALLRALYKANQYAAALELFHRIRTEQRLQLNTELYNTALMCCQRLRLWNKSLQLLWLMEHSGLTVTTASYNLVIGTCEGAKKPEIALQVFEHMVHQKCPADTFTYLSLARSFIWGSLWDEVEIILGVSFSTDLFLVYFHWNLNTFGFNQFFIPKLATILRTYTYSYPPLHAFQLTSNVSLYNAIIQGMCLRGSVEAAKRLYKKMREIGLVPDGKTRAMMLQHLLKDSPNKHYRAK
ncbi:hypothetical protein V2J09_015749 [Rumex salicifolius]